MLNSVIRWFKNLMHTPSRVLGVMESVHDTQRKIYEIDERLKAVEQAVLALPVPERPDFTPLHEQIDALTALTGSVRAAQLPVSLQTPPIGEATANATAKAWSQAEFKIFSQFGDDGIIEYLTSLLKIKERRFIEFGVETYRESNTRFLMQNRNWSGLIMDGSDENIDWIKKQEFYWRHDLTAVSAFIDVDNINELIEKNGFAGPIGLLSVDIDGNDYWVWRAINVCDPVIVVSEYNSTFGPDACVTVPYQPDFQRTKAHFSNLYWGVSLAALHKLAQEKGYSFVGCNNAGNNAYFVRDDSLGPLKALTPREGFVAAKFRESRDAEGTLTFAPPAERRDIIGECQVFDVGTLKMVQVKQLVF